MSRRGIASFRSTRSPAVAFGADRDAFAGRSVVLIVGDMAKAAAALIDLDGVARRILLCPPGWDEAKLAAAAELIDADALAFDEDDPNRRPCPSKLRHPVRLPLRAAPVASPTLETEWVLPTSGTSGPPKLAVHTLHTLMGAIAPAPLQQWATFYDIRRYGGLQIFLRALAGRGSLRLSGVDEEIEGFLARCGACGVTHISGTPTHWRMALFSGAAASIDPEYVRLSGEIADDPLARATVGRLPARANRARLRFDRGGRGVRGRRWTRRFSGSLAWRRRSDRPEDPGGVVAGAHAAPGAAASRRERAGFG